MVDLPTFRFILYGKYTWIQWDNPSPTMVIPHFVQAPSPRGLDDKNWH